MTLRTRLRAELAARLLRVAGAGDPSRTANSSDVVNCYRYLLGREPDDRGYRGFLRNLTERPTTVEELTAQFLTSEEFRVRFLALSAPVGELPERIDLHAGYHLYALPSDTEIGGQLRRAKAYEQKLSDRIAQLLSPGSVFVDVGASIGVFSVMAARIVGPQGRVIAIEPGAQNRSLLLLNLVSNGLDNVETVLSAVDERNGVVLYGQSKGNGFIQAYEDDPTALSSFDLVPARRLDDILADEARVDVVKIDVEGAEGRVFRGAQRLLESRQATIFFEFAPPALAARSSMEAVELLATTMDFGYRFDVVMEGADDLVDLSVHQVIEVFEQGELEHLDLAARPRP